MEFPTLSLSSVMPTDERLQRYEAILKPFVDLDQYERHKIRERHLNFPDPDGKLRTHLAQLGAPDRLADQLVWIPFARLEHVEKIGRGGFATVYKGTVTPLDARGFGCFLSEPKTAWDRVKKKWNKLVPDGWTILKAKPEYCETIMYAKESLIFAFKEINVSMVPELILSVSLQHYGTPEIIGLSQNPDGCYLMAMAYAQHGNLDNVGRLDQWDQILFAAKMLAEKMNFIHANHVIHRDVHPGNVVFYHSDQPAFIDVGLSTAHGDDTQEGIYGRIEYLPPEVFCGEPYTKASDIYCLGTLLWQLVTCVPPRGTASWAIQTRPDGMREETIPGAPDEYNNIIRACWNLDPKKRPTAETVVERTKELWIIAEASKTLSPVTRAFVDEIKEAHEKARITASASFSFVEGSCASSVAHTSRFFTREQLNRISEQYSKTGLLALSEAVKGDAPAPPVGDPKQ